MSNRWAIVDDDGTIEEGEEVDVRAEWTKIVEGRAEVIGGWTGDLRLVEIHGVHR